MGFARLRLAARSRCVVVHVRALWVFARLRLAARIAHQDALWSTCEPYGSSLGFASLRASAQDCAEACKRKPRERISRSLRGYGARAPGDGGAGIASQANTETSCDSV
jgi:hypothetical protein